MTIRELRNIIAGSVQLVDTDTLEDITKPLPHTGYIPQDYMDCEVTFVYGYTPRGAIDSHMATRTVIEISNS